MHTTRYIHFLCSTVILFLAAGSVFGSKGPDAGYTVTPSFGAEGDIVWVGGSGFVNDPSRYSAALRDPLGGGATATVIAAQPDRLTLQLDPAARAFTGKLEIQEGLKQQLPEPHLVSGPRTYAVSAEWFESSRQVKVAPFEISSPSLSATESSGNGPLILWVPGDNGQGIQASILLGGPPPKIIDGEQLTVGKWDLALTSKSLTTDRQSLTRSNSSTFGARLHLTLISGPADASPSELAADLAAAMNQAFQDFGIVAGSSGSQLILAGSDVAGGFATLVLPVP